MTAVVPSLLGLTNRGRRYPLSWCRTPLPTATLYALRQAPPPTPSLTVALSSRPSRLETNLRDSTSTGEISKKPGLNLKAEAPHIGNCVVVDPPEIFLFRVRTLASSSSSPPPTTWKVTMVEMVPPRALESCDDIVSNSSIKPFLSSDNKSTSCSSSCSSHSVQHDS